MSEPKCYQATPHGTLLEQIMDSRVAKTEREWAACREIERKDAAIAELVAAGRAVVDRWDSPLWKDLPHTGEFIAKLRDAIAKYDK